MKHQSKIITFCLIGCIAGLLLTENLYAQTEAIGGNRQQMETSTAWSLKTTSSGRWVGGNRKRVHNMR
jgi:hypothetical protein